MSTMIKTRRKKAKITTKPIAITGRPRGRQRETLATPNDDDDAVPVRANTVSKGAPTSSPTKPTVVKPQTKAGFGRNLRVADLTFRAVWPPVLRLAAVSM